MWPPNMFFFYSFHNEPLQYYHYMLVLLTFTLYVRAYCLYSCVSVRAHCPRARAPMFFYCFYCNSFFLFRCESLCARCACVFQSTCVCTYVRYACVLSNQTLHVRVCVLTDCPRARASMFFYCVCFF